MPCLRRGSKQNLFVIFEHFLDDGSEGFDLAKRAGMQPNLPIAKRLRLEVKKSRRD